MRIRSGRLVAAVATSALLATSGCSGGKHQAPATSPAAAAANPAPATAQGGLDLAAGLPDATPTLLTIPKINVRAPVEQTGADREGNPETPPFDHPGDVGWFTRTASPGAKGSAVIWGHLDTPTGTAVFLNLSTLAQGDVVQVSRDDGAVATFTVERTADFPKDEFPGDLVYGDSGYPALRLITCGGSFDRKAQAYDENVVVFARLTSVTAPLIAIPHPAPVNIPIPQPTSMKPTPTKSATPPPTRGAVPSGPHASAPPTALAPQPAAPIPALTAVPTQSQEPAARPLPSAPASRR